MAVTKQQKAESTVAESRKPQDRYWNRERSVGQFQRTFIFPLSINVTGVRASPKDGILHVSIPKVQKQERRRTVSIGLVLVRYYGPLGHGQLQFTTPIVID